MLLNSAILTLSFNASSAQSLMHRQYKTIVPLITMNFRTLTILAIFGLLFISSLDAAKPAKGKGKKGGEIKVEKVKNEKAADPALGEAVVLEESPVIGEIPTPKIFRPKQMKMVTAYDKCKMECQKIRDQQDLHSYAAQLREELAAAEAILLAEAPLEEEPAVAA